MAPEPEHPPTAKQPPAIALAPSPSETAPTAVKSTGPRTDAGKQKVRWNAVTHGLTAQSPLLPGEDPVAYAHNVLDHQKVFNPLNEVEASLVVRMANESWVLRRVEGATVAQITHDVRNTVPRAAARRPRPGRRVLRSPAPRSPCAHGGLRPRNCSAAPNTPLACVPSSSPPSPAATGCSIDSTGSVSTSTPTDAWHERDGFELVRLLGRYIADMVNEDSVAIVLLASQCLAADDPSTSPMPTPSSTTIPAPIPIPRSSPSPARWTGPTA